MLKKNPKFGPEPGRVKPQLFEFGSGLLGSCAQEFKTDDVVKAAGEVFGSQADMVAEQFLFDADGPSLCWLRVSETDCRESRQRLVAVDLVEAWLLDALAVENPEEGIAAHAFAVQKNQRGSRAGNDAGAKIGVGFGAASEIQRSARDAVDSESPGSRLDCCGAREGH